MSSSGATRTRSGSHNQTPADPVTAFAREVVAGAIKTNKLAKLACARHLKDLEHGPARGLAWDLGKALYAIEFFSLLRHYKGKWAGTPLALSPFQAFQIGAIFGWVWAATGLRRFRTAYIEEPRKNGKTAKSAGIGLLLLIGDGEPGAEVYAAATKKEQAELVWGDAAQFVRKSPSLSRRIQPFRHSLISPKNAGKFVPLSADDKTMDGLNPSGVIIDELHRHPTRAIVDVMRTAQGAREQPLQVEITTAGDNVESVCWEHHEYSKNVLEGVFEDDAWFAYIAAADPDDDWTNEATWFKANPNLGVSKDLDYMRTEFRRALNQPAEQREFKRLHLGIWSESAGGWMPMDRWNGCALETDDAKLKGRKCVAGVDLSATTDVTAYVELYLPTREDPRWVARPFFWLPQAKIDAAKRGEFGDLVRYDLWHEKGLINATEGDVVDYDAVLNFVTARAEKVKVLEIGVDPWNATQFMTDLTNAGFPVVEVRQGYKTLSEPTKKLLELVLANKFAHDGHPVMRWMMSNVSIDRDPADNHKPSKKLSRQRIDGPVALIIALSRGLARLGSGTREPIYAGIDVNRLMEDMRA